MKRNLPLYILIVFLIIVNSFFLYNYLGTSDKEEQTKERKPPTDFLINELGFDKNQIEQFRELEKKHDYNMRSFSEELTGLKDELFKGLSDESLEYVNIDSIAMLIGEKEAAKDLEVLRYFKQVQEFCNAKQKEKFSKIIKDALRRGDKRQGPPRGMRPGEDRPPRPEGRNGNGPPPNH